MAIVLNTTAERVADWLERRTRKGDTPPIRTDTGLAFLHAARRSAPGRLTIESTYVVPYKKDPNQDIGFGPFDAIAFDLQQLASERVEVRPSCSQELFLPYLAVLLDEMADLWPEARAGVAAFLGRPAAEEAPPVASPPVDKRGANVRTQERFKVFQELKAKHPTWSQAKVAMEACGPLAEAVTADTVGNTYKLMGKPWKRGDRAR